MLKEEGNQLRDGGGGCHSKLLNPIGSLGGGGFKSDLNLSFQEWGIGWVDWQTKTCMRENDKSGKEFPQIVLSIIFVKGVGE